MLCLGNFFPSTPTKGLEVCLHLMPLDLVIREAAEKASIRIRGRNRTTWDGYGQGTKRGHLSHYPKVNLTIDTIKPIIIWDNPINLNTESMTNGAPYDPSSILLPSV